MTEKERLKAFENMLSFAIKRYEETVGRMEALKAEGKTKTATYRQLMGDKLTQQNLLSLYRLFGLLEKEG